jgi:hypothetical protein
MPLPVQLLPQVPPCATTAAALRRAAYLEQKEEEWVCAKTIRCPISSNKTMRILKNV